jgi:excisionase family DNA binding protein
MTDEEPQVPEVLTAEEAAELLRISTKTLRRLHIPYARVGKRRRYMRSDVLTFIKDKVA